MEPLILKLFGEVKLIHGADGDIALPRKTQMLLAYLASNSEQHITRDKLAGLLWADRGEEQARHSLRQCLFTLAKSIGDDAGSLINADRHSISLNPDVVEVDIWSFERLLAQDTPDAMRQAAAQHVDEFLAGIRFDDESLDTWCAAERTRFRELCYETLVKLSSHYGDTARLDDAIDAGRRLVALDPLREDGHRTLMRHYSRAGRRAEAFKQYRSCQEILRAELNVAPEAATLDLFLEIKERSNEGEAASETADDPSGQPDGTEAPEQAMPPAAANRKWLIFALGLFLVIVLAAAVLGLNIGQSN
ncbi:MAG: BTAD domain-containing putative transcriptional regulator [Alphaproteobacteria bacterium]|nr:BTAD domain-containing putative transcriptional regulator [Alphaproteobacteria bacterium]